MAGEIWTRIPGSVRDFIEVGGLLGCAVMIGLLCSRIGGQVMDAVGVICNLVIFFAAGWLFLTRKVLKDHDAKAFLVQSLFSVMMSFQMPLFSFPLSLNYLPFAPSRESHPPLPSCLSRKNGKTDPVFLGSQTVFMVSCSMFCLILFEVLDVLSHEARWLNWKFDLSLLSVLLIFALPFYFFYLLLSNVDLGYKQAAVFAFVPTALYLWAFYTVTNSLPITGDLYKTLAAAPPLDVVASCGGYRAAPNARLGRSQDIASTG
jgi:hypothetical protein